MKASSGGAVLLLVLSMAATPGWAQGAAAAGQGVSPDITRWLGEPDRCRENGLGDLGQSLPFATALRAVVCQNTRLRASAGSVTQARAALNRAQARWQPSLTLRGGVDGARGEKTQSSAAIDLDWVLFDFGASSAAVRESRQALQAALHDQSVEVLSAIAQAAQLYAVAQAAFWRFEAANTNVHTALKSLQMAKARMGAGAASQLESLQAETALAQTRLEFARALSAWMSARGELSLSMGLSASHPLVLAPTGGLAEAFDETPIDTETLVQEARGSHPRVAASRARQAVAQTRAASFESQRWGSVSLGARVGHSRILGSSLGNNSTGSDTSASLSWSVPLLDREVLRSQIQDAQGQSQARAAELGEAERLTALQVWQEAQALLGERSALRASRNLLDNALASLKVSTERYRLGVGTFTDLLQAQNASASARLQWAEARANLVRAHWRLAAAAGRFGALKLSMQDGQALPR